MLLGYAANDPPVSYLLQGLHTRGIRESQAALCVRQRNQRKKSGNEWRDSGVRALAYSGIDGDHSALCGVPYQSGQIVRTIRSSVAATGSSIWPGRGPRTLTPYERGQVASLVRTDKGARLFADADPPLPGEWLCVFDRNVRYGPVGLSFDDSQPNFDPLVEYRLDDDPPRPPSTWGQTDHPGDDLASATVYGTPYQYLDKTSRHQSSAYCPSTDPD